MEQDELPPESVPTRKCVLMSHKPEPEDPDSVTPWLQATFQCVAFPLPIQLSTVVSVLLAKLMAFSSPPGW